ncbi:hypothetical protein SDRG_09996 [Saprolegnia diclina VS20]|uniref:CCR4-NOT transcription complex subunit 3 n=1 Tax=Saprolegnia diclina (strain VS20) TaxID=1156394 RepID=T0QC06_SAPDV|nr:hypothetical protein SDRG_09996 [Saprolegnia diclina VS20]EQC32246.1 hypothetical protein SDRG_09996 [Saprolegnia diclina VS20]|eukprot:XP_008614187.1 hypothetical protein SDRG_09996 [Saprolegnia diclina VS20]
MAGQRKLLSEIERTLKKVGEGVEVFNAIWEKVYSAAGQSQKEKHEADLKKEIKKLQRFRDQIKTWIGNSDVKDKRPLMDARRLIESKMEEFKVCEKETKTKAYSKEGLAQAERLDPAEQAKQNTRVWIQESITQFNEQIETMDCDLERLRSAKGKKNKQEVENLELIIARHKWHVLKLEQVARLLDNDAIDPVSVDALKDDIDYYLEANQEPDFMDTYGDDDIYEILDLDSLSSIQFNAGGGDAESEPSDEEVPVPTTPASRSTSGRGSAPSSAKKAPTPPITSIGRPGAVKPIELKTSPAVVVNASPPPAPSTPAAPARVARDLPPKVATPDRSYESPAKPTPVVAPPAAMRPPPAMSKMDSPARPIGYGAAVASGSFGMTVETDTVPAARKPIGTPKASPPPVQSPPPVVPAPAPAPYVMSEERRQLLRLIDESFKLMPDSIDSEKGNRYVPRNMYPTPPSFPSAPAPLFENPAVFEKFDLDTLFFIFYYQQGTYQQFLAARELKRQAWGYHKKYKTWFKRHEEPQMTGEDFEQGTFVYLDYETGWCQRIKTEFTFEYSYLEDELVV